MNGPVFCEIENNRIYITSEMTDRDRCKQIPGSRWDKDKKQWHVPISWSSCKVLRSTFMDRLQIGPALMEWAKKEVGERIQPSVALRDALTVADSGGLVEGLYSFQQAGAQFLITAGSALLGDPMGAGKTIQVIAAARAVNALPMLVICPNSMKRTWGREVTKWWPGVGVTVLEGTAAQRTKLLSQFGLGNMGTCPTHNAHRSGDTPSVTPKSATTRRGSVDPVTKKISDNVIQNSPNDNETTTISGTSIQTGEFLSGNTNPISNEQTGSALSAETKQPTSIMITQPVKSGGYCASSVTDRSHQQNKITNGSFEQPCTCNLVLVINWESVRLHSRLAPYGSIALTDKEKLPKELNQIPFKLVVADEAHRMKDPKSKQTRAVWAVGHSPTVMYRWALSGTPLTNKPDTLWPILHFLNPNEWPGKTAFVDRYCLSSLNVWGGLEVFGINPNTEAEFFDIFDPRFRRMPKEIILPQLPPIVHETRYVEMNKKQADAYKAMVENLCSVDSNGEMIVASNPISQLTRCTQYASAYLEVQDDGSARLSDPSCKLDQLMEDLEDISEPVVVFAVSRQLIDMASVRLEKAGIKHSVVKGGQSNDQRQNAIDAFQNGLVDVILVVIAAGGVGITLTRSRIAIFLQRSWSNVDQQQAIGRVHRIGSEIHESVVVLDYVTQGTIEEGQLAVLAGKADSLEEIIRDKDAIRRLMNGEVI